MGNTGSGTKTRHASGEDTAPTLTASWKYAENGLYPIRPFSKRHKGNASAPSQVLSNGERRLPTVFKWEGGGKDVYVTGSFNNWKTKIPLTRSHGDFFTIIDLPIGEHQYKFYVDGQWVNSPNDPVTRSDIGTQNNIMTVKLSDFDAFEALAVDGNEDSKKAEPVYSQDIPPRVTIEGKNSGPPALPSQLLDFILNKDIPKEVEPTLLPEPNHVMLNHLYALSIKDGVMVLGATHRFRKKYVTTLLYKPIEPIE